MEEKINFIEPLVEQVETYGKTTFELMKLKTLYKTSDVLSSFISRGMAFAIFSLFLAMANIAGALWLGELLGKLYYGFLCIAVFYWILGCILYFGLHNLIKKKVNNSIISQVLN